MGLKAYGRGLNGPDTPRAAFHDIAEGCDAVAVSGGAFQQLCSWEASYCDGASLEYGSGAFTTRHRALYLHRIFESFRHVQRPKTRLQW
jgi:hypothetical protein